MHLAFMPYGIKNFLDFVIDDLNHKYLPLRLYKEGEKDKHVLMQCQVRMLPFGIYEFIFPKEFLNEVLSALGVNSHNLPYDIDKKILGFKPLDILRKFLKLKPIPEFKKIPHPNMPIPEYKKFVPFIPIGIREDAELTEKEGQFKGWTHEAI